MKKLADKILVAALLTVFLFFGAAVYAQDDQDIVSPESELYETVLLMEDTEYGYTGDNRGRALLQDRYAEKRLKEVNLMLEGRNEKAVAAIVKAYERHMLAVEKNLDEAKEEGQDIVDIEALLTEKFEKRSEKMAALLERDDLPEQAKAGIAGAIANQERAMQNFANARLKAQEAREQSEEKAIEFRERAEEKRTLQIRVRP